MIKLNCILQGNTGNFKKYIIPILFLFLISGVSFCNINKFVNAEFQSKWYWLYVGISICGLLSLFIRCKRKQNLTAYLLIMLFFYCLLRVVNGEFIQSFILLCILSFLLYYLASTIAQPGTFRYVAGSILTVAFIQALYGVAQYTGVFSATSDFSVVGNFDNPAGYASMLAFSTPFVFYFLNTSSRPIEKYIARGVYVTVFIAIMLSGSRTAMVAIIGVSLLYVIKRHKRILFRPALWKKAAVFLLISVAISGLYWIKKDSADGRMLIWRCTWDMIKEKPLFGHGYNSFKAEYMLYQASYFKQNPDSNFVLLADNVKHPFNEFLLLIAEFGLMVFLLLGLLAASIVRIYLKQRKEEQFTLLLVLLAVCIFSCFSYPFKYPFTWLIVGVCLGSLSALSCPNDTKSKRPWTSWLSIPILSGILLYFTLKDIYYERRWFKVVNDAATGRDMTYEYGLLYPHFTGNVYFMYNHAVELSRTGRLDQSLKIITMCEERMNDYDVQMLKADDYSKLRQFHKAKASYMLALQMCPNRFMPLYGLVNVYDSLRQSELAMELAREIIDKPVKVPSGAVTAIKMKMQKRVGRCGK